MLSIFVRCSLPVNEILESYNFGERINRKKDKRKYGFNRECHFLSTKEENEGYRLTLKSMPDMKKKMDILHEPKIENRCK